MPGTRTKINPKINTKINQMLFSNVLIKLFVWHLLPRSASTDLMGYTFYHKKKIETFILLFLIFKKSIHKTKTFKTLYSLPMGVR